MSSTVQSILANGTGGIVVDIECVLSNNLPTIVIVGFANKAVIESKERIRGAFADSKLQLPRKRITINLAPADIPKTDSGFDLAIAASIMLAGQLVPPLSHALPRASKPAFIGELGLDGSLRPVRGLIGKLLAGRAAGIDCFYIPTANLAQARLVPGVTLVPVTSLTGLYQHLTKANLLTAIGTGAGLTPATAPATVAYSGLQLSDVIGQAQAKRALMIAAAGGHNLFLTGPPGTGKSMLARALPSLLPPLQLEEMLEVTHLHSLASNDYERIVSQRPFRSPHHSASHTAITGGGRMRPGEISLAHRGVLLYDELPEFSRPALEALRQPLEDRVISLARVNDSVEYPADFMLVATANPCPCGYYGAANDRCDCSQARRQQYNNKISGPIMDRIDLHCNVHEVDHKSLLSPVKNANEDAKARATIAAARQLQAKRLGNPTKLNASMTNADVKALSQLDPEAQNTLNEAAIKLDISARAYMRTIKVARTIADLAGSSTIAEEHINEALRYRQPKIET